MLQNKWVFGSFLLKSVGDISGPNEMLVYKRFVNDVFKKCEKRLYSSSNGGLVFEDGHLGAAIQTHHALLGRGPKKVFFWQH